MSTEDVDPKFIDLAQESTLAALSDLLMAQASAVEAIAPALPALAAAIDGAVPRLKSGGRLIYAGAGTSARVAAQDGAELYPTFGWPPEKVAFVIAGGAEALLRPIENAEDSAEDAERQVAHLNVVPEDVFIAVAASGRTPFTLAALRLAADRGATTVGLANNRGAPLLLAAQFPVLLDTGPEPIAGSTRLKAGTAQKIALNLLSTLLMMRMGRVYRGLMVHMTATNAKLRERAVAMVAHICSTPEVLAREALAAAEGDVKVAVLGLRLALSPAAARLALEAHDGDLGKALGEGG